MGVFGRHGTLVSLGLVLVGVLHCSSPIADAQTVGSDVRGASSRPKSSRRRAEKRHQIPEDSETGALLKMAASIGVENKKIAGRSSKELLSDPIKLTESLREFEKCALANGLFECSAGYEETCSHLIAGVDKKSCMRSTMSQLPMPTTEKQLNSVIEEMERLREEPSLAAKFTSSLDVKYRETEPPYELTDLNRFIIGVKDYVTKRLKDYRRQNKLPQVDPKHPSAPSSAHVSRSAKKPSRSKRSTRSSSRPTAAMLTSMPPMSSSDRTRPSPFPIKSPVTVPSVQLQFNDFMDYSKETLVDTFADCVARTLNWSSIVDDHVRRTGRVPEQAHGRDIAPVNLPTNLEKNLDSLGELFTINDDLDLAKAEKFDEDGNPRLASQPFVINLNTPVLGTEPGALIKLVHYRRVNQDTPVQLCISSPLPLFSLFFVLTFPQVNEGTVVLARRTQQAFDNFNVQQNNILRSDFAANNFVLPQLETLVDFGCATINLRSGTAQMLVTVIAQAPNPEGRIPFLWTVSTKSQADLNKDEHLNLINYWNTQNLVPSLIIRPDFNLDSPNSIPQRLFGLITDVNTIEGLVAFHKAMEQAIGILSSNDRSPAFFQLNATSMFRSNLNVYSHWRAVGPLPGDDLFGPLATSTYQGNAVEDLKKEIQDIKNFPPDVQSVINKLEFVDQVIEGVFALAVTQLDPQDPIIPDIPIQPPLPPTSTSSSSSSSDSSD